MNRLLISALAVAGLSGCATYDYASGSGPGGYYQGRQTYEYTYPDGYYRGYYGGAYGSYGGYGYGYPGYGYPGPTYYVIRKRPDHHGDHDHHHGGHHDHDGDHRPDRPDGHRPAPPMVRGGRPDHLIGPGGRPRIPDFDGDGPRPMGRREGPARFSGGAPRPAVAQPPRRASPNVTPPRPRASPPSLPRASQNGVRLRRQEH